MYHMLSQGTYDDPHAKLTEAIGILVWVSPSRILILYTQGYITLLLAYKTLYCPYKPIQAQDGPSNGCHIRVCMGLQRYKIKTRNSAE